MQKFNELNELKRKNIDGFAPGFFYENYIEFPEKFWLIILDHMKKTNYLDTIVTKEEPFYSILKNKFNGEISFKMGILTGYLFKLEEIPEEISQEEFNIILEKYTDNVAFIETCLSRYKGFFPIDKILTKSNIIASLLLDKIEDSSFEIVKNWHIFHLDTNSILELLCKFPDNPTKILEYIVKQSGNIDLMIRYFERNKNKITITKTLLKTNSSKFLYKLLKTKPVLTFSDLKIIKYLGCIQLDAPKVPISSIMFDTLDSKLKFYCKVVETPEITLLGCKTCQICQEDFTKEDKNNLVSGYCCEHYVHITCFSKNFKCFCGEQFEDYEDEDEDEDY